jgi:hypothetical protein
VLSLSNVATSDGYTAACTLGPVPTAQKIVYLVANNSAVMQIAGRGSTEQPWSDELLVSPTVGAEIQRVQGVRFRSAVPGAPARIIANLIEPDDPLPFGGQPFTGILSGAVAQAPVTLDTMRLRLSAVTAIGSGASQAVPLAQAYDWNTSAAIWGARAGIGSGEAVLAGGIYRITALVLFNAGAGTLRELQVRLNGAVTPIGTDTPPVTAGSQTRFSAEGALVLSAGDSVDMTVFQDSGAAINITDAWLQMDKLT